MTRGPPPEDLGRARVGIALHVQAGRFGALQKQVLGAEEPDPVEVVAHDLCRIFRAADVAVEQYPNPVLGAALALLGGGGHRRLLLEALLASEKTP